MSPLGRARRSLARVVAGALAAAPALAAPCGAARDAAEWVEACASGAPEERAEGLAELRGLGAGAAPDVLTFLGGTAPESAPPALLELTSEWDPEAAVESVVRAPDLGDDLTSHLRTIRRLGTYGRGEGLGPLLATAARIAPSERRHPTVRREIQVALARVLRSEPSTLARLRLAAVEPDLEIVVVKALEAAAPEGAFTALVARLGRSEELDEIVLESLGRLPAGHEDVADGTCARALARHLTDREPALRCAAAVALGRLGDPAVFAELLPLAADPDRRVQRSALWALAELAGVEGGDSFATWDAWLRREEAWFADRAPALVETSVGGDPAVASAALRELALHRVHASVIAPQIADALFREDEAVALTACEALRRIGGPAALRALAEARDHPRDAVRAAVARALAAER